MRTANMKLCEWLQCFSHAGASCYDSVYYSDEVWVHLDSYVNSGLYCEKMGIWCGIPRKMIVGPFFFETTIKTARYQEIIQGFIVNLDAEDRICWFRQDGATARTTALTRVFLKKFFDIWIILKSLWRSRDLHLSLCDFCLWGYVRHCFRP